MTKHWENGDYYEQDGAYLDEDDINFDDGGYADYLYEMERDRQLEEDILKSGLAVDRNSENSTRNASRQEELNKVKEYINNQHKIFLEGLKEFNKRTGTMVFDASRK